MIMSLSVDKLQMWQAIQNICGFLNWWEVNIFSFLCPYIYVVHLASYRMCKRLYCPWQYSLTQRPARPDTLYTLRLAETHFELQTEYKKQYACTLCGSLLYSFYITTLWIYNFII